MSLSAVNRGGLETLSASSVMGDSSPLLRPFPDVDEKTPTLKVNDSDIERPVTATDDKFSPTLRKRSIEDKSQPNGKGSRPSTGKSRVLPHYYEMFARNQQFDCRYQPVQPILIENFASTFCNTCSYLFAAVFVAIPSKNFHCYHC